jgi:hypothetical protein
MTFLEDNQSSQASLFAPSVYAATNIDYSKRIPQVT